MIYLNNAATSYPKFRETSLAVFSAIKDGMTYCNRDSIEFTQVSKCIFQLREAISEIIGAKSPHHICFTANDTIAINMILSGMNLKKGNIILSSTREHNSVVRPLEQLRKINGVEIIYVPFKNNQLDIDYLKNILKENHKKIICGIFSHASNITGDLINVKEIGNVLNKNKIPFILDVAQTIGLTNIDVDENNITALTFSGHKGLNGPQGTGGFYIKQGFFIKPIIFGGTGNNSLDINPDIVFPDSFEIGTPAIHDLIGLFASINVIKNKIGFLKYSYKIIDVTQYLYNSLKKIDNIILYGGCKKETSIVSFNIKNIHPSIVGKYLGEKGIVCRTGAHCSAMGIKDIAEAGTVRLSCGYYTDKKTIDYVVSCILSLINNN